MNEIEYQIKETGPSELPLGPDEQRILAMTLYTFVNGRSFVGCYTVTDSPTETARLRRDCLQDLDWFIRKFWFYGCGGFEHDFPGEGREVGREYKCRKCGALKKKRMDLPAVLREARKADAAKEKGVVH